jgi:hypothetical protein
MLVGFPVAVRGYGLVARVTPIANQFFSLPVLGHGAGRRLSLFVAIFKEERKLTRSIAP